MTSDLTGLCSEKDSFKEFLGSLFWNYTCYRGLTLGLIDTGFLARLHQMVSWNVSVVALNGMSL
ncbi:MAG: hypothetical protein OXE41_04990 [Gammaproteobacteria bacterium]|nr:hypothetical protein [Gammaproteobacteria bacterium]MCY4218443.1 hypothetical protein [Gammaproteobacteria bacterium]MCY4274736.1 hypothetical protein [Gammaproteobacteria bacterium]